MVIKDFCYIFCLVDENSIRLKSNTCSKHQLPARLFLICILLFFSFRFNATFNSLAMLSDLKSRFSWIFRTVSYVDFILLSRFSLSYGDFHIHSSWSSWTTQTVQCGVCGAHFPLSALRGVSQGFIILKKERSKK